MNNVNIIGRLVRENDLRYTQSGKAVLTNSIAVDNGFGDNKKTYFLPVVVWDKSAEAMANFTDKGSKVAINGKITSRTYETKDGQKRTSIEIVANQYDGVEFLDTKKSGTGVSNNQTNNYTQNNQNVVQAQTNANNNMPNFDRDNSDPFGASSIDISDDSLPF